MSNNGNETRDILDANNVVIGSITLPAGTRESVWAEKLAIYSYVPKETQADIIADQLNDAISFGDDLLKQIAVDDLASGIAQATNVLDIVSYMSDIRLMLISGYLAAAVKSIDTKIAAGVPDALSPYVTADILSAIRKKLATYLGLSS